MKKQLLACLMSILALTLFGNQAEAQGYIAASTYLGGSAQEQNPRMVVLNGETYMIGNTTSSNFPVTTGSGYNGGSQGDNVVTKLDANGNIIWSRYLGGSDNEYPSNLAVSNGSVFVVGTSFSSNYPVTNGSTQAGGLGAFNAVFTKLNASTGAIQFSTYMGQGSMTEVVISGGNAYLLGAKYFSAPLNYQIHLAKFDIATNNFIFDQTYGGDGNDYTSSLTYSSSCIKVVGDEVFIAGGTSGTNFPVTNGSTRLGTYDHVFMRLNANNGNILFATYYGGSNGATDYGILDLRVDNTGTYILGLTMDTDFPVTDGSTNKGMDDFYLIKFDINSNAVLFSKYLGSQEDEFTGAMEVQNGTIFISGWLTSSNGYPHTSIPGSYTGASHNIISKLNATTGNMIYSTWLHSNSSEDFSSLKVVNGDAYILGLTSGNPNNIYPVTNGSKKTGSVGDDIVLTKINSNNQLCFSTFLGGNNDEYPTSLAIENDMVYLTGFSGSTNFPVTNSITKKTSQDYIWTKFNLNPNLVVTSDNVSPATQTVCKNGMANKLTAPAITFPADSMPTIYRNAIPSTQNAIDLKYQWQQAPSASGPWTNIPAAIQQDYNPQVGLVDVYYRRIANASVCGSNSPISTSSVASVLVNANTAPTVTVGNVVNTCVGSSVLLGGSPTATANGGATITSYLWTPSGTYSPNNAVANPTVTATATTIYNVLVTDNNGCQQIGQQLVNAYAANAGLDKSACNGQAVRIGTAPIAGLPGVVYSWTASPADPSMSCTSCAQPDVNPTVVTTYTLSLTVPITGGGTCTTTDIVIVTPVAAPVTANFAGSDVTICSGSTATLGMPSESGFTYTWAPGNYLVSNNAAQVTFQPGSLSMPNPDPITYFLTASKSGCSFVDQMVASVIEARAGSDGCGPRTLGEGDRTPNISETYLWTKISGDGNIIGANNLPQVNVSATTSGNTIYQLSVTHNGTTCTDQVVVPVCGCPVPNIAVQAPNSCASYVLNGGTVALTATSPLNCTFSWSPSAGLSSSTGATVYLTDNVSRTYTVTATSVVDPSFFCTNTRTVNNPAWSLPVFTAKDTTICPGNSVNIGQAPVAGYDYQWSGNTSYLSSTTGSNPTATVTSTNTFSVLVTDVGSGCTTRDTASVTIVGLPANVAGDDAALCGSGQVQLGKDAQPNVTYIWTPATSYVPNNTSANPTVTVATTTSFTVVATNTLTGCSITDTVNVTVNPAVAPFTFTNQTFCPSTAGAIPLPAGPSGMTTYSWSPASLVVNNTSNGPTATTQSTRPQSATTFILTVTNASGCIGAAPVVFTPSVSVPVTGGNKVICKDATVQLGGAPEAGATYSWASNPVTGNPFFSSTSISNPTFTPTTAGSYDVTVTKTDAGGCITTATATITVNTYTLTAIITNPTVCQNTCVEIGPSSPAPGVQYFWSPTTGLSDPNTNRPTACMTTSSTTYTLTAVAANGCMDTRTVLVGVNPSPSPTVTIPVATPCLSDVTVTLNPSVSPSGSYNYLWTPNNGTLNNIYSLNPVVNLTGVGTQTYSLTVTDNASGCSGNAVATVNVQYCPAPVGTVGNYVWTDANNNGLNDEVVTNGINGVTVELYKETTAGSGTYLVSQTTQTANDVSGNPGYYLFDITESANYFVKFPSTTNGTNSLTLQTTTAATDNNSDASIVNGQTPIFAMNVLGSGVAKDNMTLDAGYSTCVVDAGNSISLNCTNPSGTIGTASVSGNTYSWSPSTGLSATNIAQPTASPTATTTYTLTVNGSCSDTVTVYADKTAPSANAGSTQNLNCTTTSATIGTAAISGNTYSWSPTTGLNDATLAQPTASPTATTTYTVTVTGSNGCVATASVTVNVNTTAPTANAGLTQNLNCTTTSATIGTVAVSGNTYSWSPTTGLNDATLAQPIASPTATTTYTVTVTGSNGCAATASVTVNVNTTAPTANAGTNKNLNCTTTTTLIGTSAISGNLYSWSPSTGLNSIIIAQPTASPTATTTYTVTVTGANGCSATSTVTVNVDISAPVANAGTTLNLNCTTTSGSIGTASISGNSYQWSPVSGLSSDINAQPTASPSATTTYTVTVTGSNGCTAVSSVTVNVNTTVPTANAGSTQNLNCTTTSATIGSAAVSGNTYSWLPTTGLNDATLAQPTASPTATTTYTVTVTGANGCTSVASVTVNYSGNPPNVNPGATQNLNCITTSASIGSSAVSGNTYSWLPAAGLDDANLAQPTASPTSTTTYTVTVAGSNGCTSTASVTVNVNTTAPTADAGNTQNLDCTSTSATIGSAAVSGNTYSWSPTTGLNDATLAQPTASPTSTTTYTVTVTGSNGCTSTASVTVNVNTTAPTVDAGPTQNLDCTATSSTIGSAAVSGNTYSWSPTTGLNDANLAQPTASPTLTTTYTVTVTGSNGCAATASVTVNVNTTAPTADAGSPKMIDCNITSVSIGSSSVSGNTYAWLPTAGLNDATLAQPTASPTATTTYTVSVTRTNGCVATSTVEVTVNASLGTIGNYVWNDMNNNGLNDENTNAGLNAVTVELWKETSPSSGLYSLSQTTSTDYNGGNPGYYSFTVCESANYKVKFPITNNAGSPLTQQTTTAATDNNSDANLVDGFSPVFAIDINGTGSDKDNMTIDAGYYVEPACLGNYIWNDINKDGIQNNGEVGVAGISVSLLDNGLNTISSTLTDAYGFYQFCSLVPGTYSVIFTLPSNYTFTSQNATTDEADSDVDPITGITTSYVLAAGDSNMTADAGIYFEQPITASVGNYVWLDVNQNGIQDNNEQGISGVTVTLYNSAGDAVATMPTNANGFYLFTNVTPGNYSVGFTAPVGLSFTVQNGATNNASNSDADPSTGVTVPFTVNAGDEITYVDAGLFSLPQNVGSLGNRVWYDEDQDGVQDATETGVNNVIVTLYQQDGTTILNETVTDAYGNYIFNNLPQGGYVVGFSNLPLNYVFTTTSGTDSATNSDANIISGKTAIIYLAQGQHNMTYDAGIYTTQSANTNSVGNFVWDDLNKDGIQTNNEPGVAGVTVTLYNNTNAAIATTSTDANGLYLFPNLPNGTYSVGFSNLPLNYVFSIMGQGTSATDNDADPSTGKTTTTTLTGNTHDMTLDAGINFGSTRLGLGTLGDLVWYDMNNNGLQDNNELGVQGVTVTLYESNGTTVISTTTTNALGNYIFTGLEEGAYVVGFDNLPSGFSLSPKNADNQGINGEANSDVNSGTNQTDLINLGDGEDKMSVDMGITPPAGTAGLGNYVWMDLNNDGLQTSGEPGVQGIGVTLYDNTNTAIATTTTDANGAYSFVGLTPGTYSVGFDNLPSGFGFTSENSDAQGINGVSNSDANTSTGMTSTVTLAAGDYNPNLDAGIVSTTVASVGDYVWYDMNQDGLQDANEPGIGGILVTLYNSSNTAVASTITRPDGSYIFTNVTPGDYTMGFSNIPSGMEFTQEVGTATDNNNSNVTPSTGLTATFTVIAGTHNPTIDAGLTTPINAGLGNYVWFDVDKDGVQDSNEPGIAGAIVTLYAQDGTSVLGTAITDGNGAYTFTNLPAGQYSICVGNVPYIFHSTGNRMVAVPTVQNAAIGTDETDSDVNPLGGCTINYTLAAGEYNPTLDAGFVYQFAVPVVMKDFTVLNDQCNVFVNWVTSSEKNTSHYNVMRTSTTNNTTTKVAQIMAKGNTQNEASYSYTDREVATGTYTYHLEIVDIDGQQSLSDKKSVQVNCQTNTDKVSVYPNPTTGQLNIRIVSEQNDEYTINVRDAVGRLVMQSTMEVNNTTKNMVMNLGGFAAGTYSVEVLGYYQTQTFKIQLSK